LPKIPYHKNKSSSNNLKEVKHGRNTRKSTLGRKLWLSRRPGSEIYSILKGCNMRCKYCHNPDTWAKCGKNDGAKLMTPQEVLKTAMRYKAYWKQTGGITVSGGEALLQIDFVTELFKLAKEKGVNTCLDTSGNPFTVEEPFFGKFNELMKYTDLFMLDIKHIDDEEHKKLTGQTNKNILDMLNISQKR